MSSFHCDICQTECIDTENGYITGCQHYPTQIMLEEQARLARIGGRPCEWSQKEWDEWSRKEPQ